MSEQSGVQSRRQDTEGESLEQTRRPGQPGVQPNGPQPGSPTIEQIADRVYELLCEDLRLERERMGW